MLRLIFAVIFVVLFLILTLPLLLILWIVGKFNQSAKDNCSLAIIKWAFKGILFFAGTKMDVYGAENIPEDRSVLFVGNHRSIFDILILYVNMKRPTGIISKKEIKKVPIFNIWMKNIRCIFLDRSDIKEGLKMVLGAIEMVKEGISIAIFPEGTRNKEEGTFLPFKGGSFKIAEKSGCDVIPFAILNSAEIFENHKPSIKKTHVIIEFGEAIHTAGLSRDELKLIPDKARDSVIMMHNNRVNEI